MAAVIYTLCALTSALAWALLFRSYRATKARLLLWSSLCFALLTLNNVLLVVDRVLLPTQVDLSLWRHATALAAVLLLLHGLVWEDD
jgi:hypothetical protein